MEGSREPWLRIARRRDVVQRALRISAVVGTIVFAINHGDRVLTGALTSRDLLKIALTYFVPYVVSTYAAVSAIRAERR